MINNTNQKVWSYLINVSRWKEWDTELKEARIFKEFSEGAMGELKPKKGPKLKFQIDEIKPFESYTFTTKMPLSKLVIKRKLLQRKGQIEFTDEIKFTGIFKPILGYLFGRGFKKALPEVMNNFKIIAEKE